MKVLLTGGAGYIGSHIYLELLQQGYKPIILDNLVNSEFKTIKNLALLSGGEVPFFNIDICDKNSLENFFYENSDIYAIIHCAGLKSVPDSIQESLKYYHTNVLGTLNLLSLMDKYDIRKMIFSSSASVYGHQSIYPINENAKINPFHPYGHSKAMIEQILRDYSISNSKISIVILRYFNPIGAHESGLIGESLTNTNLNIMSYIIKVAKGENESLSIYGNDYPTSDGTPVRDFIHVVDLAKGHVSSLNFMHNNFGIEYFNLGTGEGHTVLELVNTFEKINNINIPIVFRERRMGDIPISYSDVSKARKILNWRATKTLEDMCRDSWNRYNVNLKESNT